MLIECISRKRISRLPRACFLLLFGLSTAATSQSKRVSEIGGWPDVVSSLLAQYADYDVLALGEAHGREADAELRVRLVRHPNVPRTMRLIVAEFHDGRLASAVADVNERRSPAEQIRIVVGSASASMLIAERVRRGEKAVVVYGAGHVWKREGRLTTGLSSAGVRVLVVQTIAPPTLEATLAQVDRGLQRQERPLLISLRDSPTGQLRAVDLFPHEPISPSIVLADLADVGVVFARARPVERAGEVATAGLGAGATIRLSGRLAGLFPRGSSVYFLVAVEAGLSASERWAVRAGSAMELEELGWSVDLRDEVELGDRLTLEGRIASRPNEAAVTADMPQQVADAARSGRLLIGAAVTLPNGGTLRLVSKP